MVTLLSRAEEFRFHDAQEDARETFMMAVLICKWFKDTVGEFGLERREAQVEDLDEIMETS